jgi:hypothetical protein
VPEQCTNQLKRLLIIVMKKKLRTLLARIISLEGFEVLQAADSKVPLKKWNRLL